MPRPPRCRFVSQKPKCCSFIPGQYDEKIEGITLKVEEFEAMRLKYHVKKTITIANQIGEDREKLMPLNQQEAAAAMGVSQSTFSRILEQAHVKVTEALVNGYALHVSGGHYGVKELSYAFGCQDCLKEWPVPSDFEASDSCRPECPSCNSQRTYLITRQFVQEPPKL